MTMNIPTLTLLAARAKTRIKHRGMQGVSEISNEEIMALAFIADHFLDDYTGPMVLGDENYEPHPYNPNMEKNYEHPT